MSYVRRGLIQRRPFCRPTQLTQTDRRRALVALPCEPTAHPPRARAVREAEPVAYELQGVGAQRRVVHQNLVPLLGEGLLSVFSVV